jgi:CrcB protein
MGTLIVNVLACLVLGVATAFADQKLLLGTSSKLFWTVGFCGGFSTFSTFSNESLTLLNSGFQLMMLLYILLSVVMCLAAVWTGLYLGKLI